MKYLYGDATESPLDINYLDLLHDVLDFGASVMLAHGTISSHRARAKELQEAAKVERDQLEGVNDEVDKALVAAKSRVTTKNTKACVDAIRAVALAEIKRADSGIQGRLTAELGQMNEQIAREQANNVRRLEALLLKHDLPECALWVNTRFHDKTNRYIAELIGKASCDVAFVIDLEVPNDHLLAEPLRIDRLAPGLTIKVPEKSGWVRKSVKMRPHKLAKEYVVAVSHSTKRTTIKLRNALQDADSGYDLIFGTKNRVAVSRLAKGSESEPFEPDIADKKDLLAFYDELNRSLNELKSCRRALRGAQLDSTPLAEHADATVLVRRLVQQMAPVVSEISKHSLSPRELVLKRVLADNRREEIFLSKANLRSKLDPLSAELRQIFAPLALDVVEPDITGPPPPIRAGKTQVMEDPRSARPTPAPRAPAQTLPEPATQRRTKPGVPDDSPVVIVKNERSPADQEVFTGLPQIEDVATSDEALPLPLAATAVVPDAQTGATLRPGSGAQGPTLQIDPAQQTPGVGLSPPPQRGVSMPSKTKRSRGHRSAAPPVPPSSGTALPKPSSPPKRGVPRGKGSGPGIDIQAHDSVDVQLDELLKSE